VVSQFHGVQLVSFSDECYEWVLMLFFRTCFSLPVGFPRAIFYFFAGPLEFSAVQMCARLKFFHKHAWKNGRMRDLFLQDRILYLLGRECWNDDFSNLYEAFFHGRRYTEFDLFSPLNEFRMELELESVAHRHLRLTLMPSGILFQQLVAIGSYSSFARELSRRSFEEARLILLFFANMLRFSFFTRTQESCPYCPSNIRLNSTHFLECRNIFHSPLLPLPPDLPLPSEFDPWRTMCLQERWGDFFDFFFLLGLMWSRVSSSVRPSHCKTLMGSCRFVI
jgi:hypothetical protein